MTEVTTNSSLTVYEENKALFWVSNVVYLCIGMTSVVGNALVIYASHGHQNTGRLRYLDDVAKSLAISDMLFGLIGTPLRIINWYLGKNESYITEAVFI